MILLHHFTWRQFGIAAILLTFIWYAVVLLLYFRKDIAARLAKRDPGPLPHQWDDEDWDQELAGEAREDEGISVVTSDDFSFAGAAKTDHAEDELLGLVPDALEEIKSVLYTVESQEGDKSDFVSLFKLVSGKYARLKNGPHLAAINDWIRDNVPFNFSNEELTALWN